MCSIVMKLHFQIIGTFLLGSGRCVPNPLGLGSVLMVGVRVDIVDEGEELLTFIACGDGVMLCVLSSG